MKKRIRYEKTEAVSLVSHLDTLRVFIRAMRRAKLQPVYSEGFNPHPKMTFLLPISVGFTSEYELVDIDFSDNLPEEELKSRLNEALPEGFHVLSVYDGVHKINQIDSVDYTITYEQEVSQKLYEFLNQPAYITVKKSKRKSRDVDILKFIKSFEINSDILSICLCANGENSLNPKFFSDEFLKWAGIDTEYHIHRSKIYTVDKRAFF